MNDSRPALVIGYGNTLRNDDAVGSRAATVVHGWGLPGVTALAVTQLTPELAEPLATARLAVFVDARLAAEGDLPEVEVRPLEPSGEASTFGHIGDPRRLLALARAVYGSCPRAWLVTVPAADVGLGEGLSPQAKRGLEDALARIAALLSGPESLIAHPMGRELSATVASDDVSMAESVGRNMLSGTGLDASCQPQSERGAGRIRTGGGGFADLCLTTWLRRHGS